MHVLTCGRAGRGRQHAEQALPRRDLTRGEHALEFGTTMRAVRHMTPDLTADPRCGRPPRHLSQRVIIDKPGTLSGTLLASSGVRIAPTSLTKGLTPTMSSAFPIGSVQLGAAEFGR